MSIARFLSGFSFKFPSYLPLIGIGAASILISACGGGGGGGSKTSSSSSFSYSYSSVTVSSNGTGTWPSIKVDATATKTLSFSWSAVEGASYYKLMKNQDGNSGFVQVGGNITGTSATDEISVHLHDWINTRYMVQWCNASDTCQDSNNTYTATEMLGAIGKISASNGDANDLFGWSIALSADGKTLAVGAPAEDSSAIGVNGDETLNDSRDSGAVYVFVKKDGLWVQQAYLKASNTEQPMLNTSRFLPNDRFGYRVAISDDGNTLAVSAINEDSPSGGVNCKQENNEIFAYFQSSSSDSSNSSSEISSSSIESSSSSLNTDQVSIIAMSYDIGAVYIFKRQAQTWTQTAYVKPEIAYSHVSVAQGEPLQFGQSLAISGDGKTLAVGSTLDLFSFQEGLNVITYNQSSVPACLDYNNLSSSSSSSLSSSSNSSESSSSSSSSSSESSSSSSVQVWGGSNSGAVYTYVETAEGWKSEAMIKPNVVQTNDRFGGSLALSTDGSTMTVGATGDDSQATGVNGDATDNSCFYLADVQGNYKFDAACSKYGTIDPSRMITLDNGSAYVFKRNDGLWSQQAYLKPGTNFLKANFGAAVDISGDGTRVAVGATGDANRITNIINGSNIEDKNDPSFPNAGAAYLFKFDGTSWIQEAYIKPEVNLPGYQFGNSVKLSKDGSSLAVGTFLESSNAKGINGNLGDTSSAGSGAMYIFKRDNNAWSQSAYVKASDTAAQDRFGVSAALSTDGKTLAVGAHRKTGSASSGASSSQSNEAQGAVYIY